MNVCIFGTGAVGGHLAVQCLASGPKGIALVARGAMLKAMRERGLALRKGDQETRVSVPLVTDDPQTLPPQDIVFVTMKAQALPAAASAIGRLLAPDGCAVFLLNGIPWWWRHGLEGEGGTLPLLDPKGALWHEVRPERTLGCVVHSPNEIVEPGVVLHTGPDHLIVGEPEGGESVRLKNVVSFLAARGVDVRVSNDLRRDILLKLVLNASGNTIAALARADLGRQGATDDLRMLSIQVMREVIEVARALGWDLASALDVDKLSRRGKRGDRPSMLQDVLLGRSLEVEAVLGQVQAFAREKAVAVPAIEVMLPLLRSLDRAIRGSE